MRVLVTGVAGFIGSHVADALIARGDDVYGIDNLETGRRQNVPEGCEFIHGDIHPDMPWTEPADVILHAAATYRDPLAWERDIEVNAKGTGRVATVAKHLEAQLVYFQTSLCYGPPKTAPITLNHPLNPQTSYAISKTAGEQYARLSGCDLTVFRLANMYGPRNLSGPVPAFFKRMAAGETCQVATTRRDFVYIDDLVRLIVQAIDGRVLGTYHASTGTDYPILDVFSAVSEACGSIAEFELVEPGVDDVKTLLLDPSDTYKTFRWTAETPLEDGIAQAVGWYRANGVADTYTHLAAVR